MPETDKRKKAQGEKISCPVCLSERDFSLNTGIVTTLTCNDCQTEFDSEGKIGPFTMSCPQCGNENPIRNRRCYMCALDF